MRTKKLALNTMASLSESIVSIICGFILPHQILICYGSKVNGVVSSIAQFLSIVGFLNLGVGAVVQSALYKPLAEDDTIKISQVMKSSSRYFRMVGLIILIYIIVLIPVYPVISGSDFGWTYTAVLIVAMSIDSLAKYYFGISNSLLLSADQKSYVYSILQIITLIMNTAVCIVLISYGASIQLVKTATALIYLIRPIMLCWYVEKHYDINHKIKYDKEPIAQKWNGIAQHLAVVILDGTDIIVLTVFSTLQNVSVYAVYRLVLNGIKELFGAMTKGITPLLGELWAKQEKEKLKKIFRQLEWAIHMGCVFIFGNTAVLIVSFVRIYTDGISDTDYSVPVFAVLITLAIAFECLRKPYHLLILASGHYKQTQNSYIFPAIINIMISVMCVKSLGLIGVAIGTIVAMAYQIIWQAFYISRSLIKRSVKIFWKWMALDALATVCGFLCTYRLKLLEISYVSWILLAFETVFIWMFVIVMVNFLFCRKEMIELLTMVKYKVYRINRNV